MSLKSFLHSLRPQKRTTRNIQRKTSIFFDSDESRKRSYKTKRKSIIPRKYLYPLEKIGRQKKLYFSLFWIWCTLAIALFLILGPYLRLQNIYINQSGSIININQAYNSIEYMRGKNILFLDTKTAASRLQSSQNAIKNIDFQVSLPNTLTIEISVFEAIFQANWFIMFENGAIKAQENNTVSENIPEIFISEKLWEFEIFWKTLNINELSNMQDLIEQLSKNIINFKIQSIAYYRKEKELHLQTSNDTIFIFDLSSNIFEQVERLAIFQKEWENITEQRYIYIDVRIPQKLFICWYESEFSCRTNLKTIYGEDVFTNLEKDVFPPEQ